MCGPGRDGELPCSDGNDAAGVTLLQTQLAMGWGEIYWVARPPSKKSTPLLHTGDFGITWGALQFRANRVFRFGASALSASVDVTMSEGTPFATEVLRRHILNALFVKFFIDEGAKAFDLGDPAPRGDVAYDSPITWYFEISHSSMAGMRP